MNGVRFFHLYSDGKTVREIDRQTYLKYLRNRKNFRLARVGNGFIALIQYDRENYVAVNQVRQILEATA